MSERDEIPGWEGTIGPSPAQYGLPHVYARDTTSGAGNCVCGLWLSHERHVQAAPGVDVPKHMRRAAAVRDFPAGVPTFRERGI
jgi:hypothetical protein